tara:strand:+ start:6085 stop:7077 length:993 start_codon:yes stop_codon:yes gene_type:complete
MIKAGYIKLHRKLLDSEVFSDPKMLKTWIWILMSANWERRKTISGIVIERGEFVTGFRKASEQLGIGKNTIARHFKRFEFLEMIQTFAGSRGTRVVVEKYNDYQSSDDSLWSETSVVSKLSNGTINGTDIGTGKNGKAVGKNRLFDGLEAVTRDGKGYADGEAAGDADGDANGDENKNTKNIKNTKNTYSVSFGRFWEAYPRKVSKGKAFAAFKKAAKSEDADVIISAASEYSKSSQGRGMYCPYPASWLNAQRWLDDRKEWNDGAKVYVASKKKVDPKQKMLDAYATKLVAMRTAFNGMPEGENKDVAIKEWMRCKEIFGEMERDTNEG